MGVSRRMLALLTEAAGGFNKTRLRELLKDPVIGKNIVKFVEAMAGYQSNTAGDYWKEPLAERYEELPEEFKKAIAAIPAKLKKLHRGDDGKSKRAAISWTTAADWAKFFGHFVYKYSALKSHGGTIDTVKVWKLLHNVKELEDYQVGDDEGEVIILNPVWKNPDPEVLE